MVEDLPHRESFPLSIVGEEEGIVNRNPLSLTDTRFSQRGSRVVHGYQEGRVKALLCTLLNRLLTRCPIRQLRLPILFPVFWGLSNAVQRS